jgi:hypothetical protein
MQEREPRNPFYFLLLITSLLFVVTALAYAVVPVLETKAAQSGQTPPSSPWRELLRHDGWIWLLTEVGFVALFSALSMGLDRLRSLRKERNAVTIPPSGSETKSATL